MCSTVIHTLKAAMSEDDGFLQHKLSDVVQLIVASPHNTHTSFLKHCRGKKCQGKNTTFIKRILYTFVKQYLKKTPKSFMLGKSLEAALISIFWRPFENVSDIYDI